MAKRKSAATRRRISEGKTAWYRKQYEERDPANEPTLKRCNKCQEWLPVEKFYTRRYKRKSGFVSVLLSPRCRQCTQEDHREYAARREREGIDIKRREFANHKRWVERNRERKNRYQREWRRAKRLEEGKEPGPVWHKYRAEAEETAKDLVPVEPLAEFLHEKGHGPAEISIRSGLSERSVTRILHQEHRRVSLRVVDEILMGLGCQEELHTLYPLEERENIVGYAVLDGSGAPLDARLPAGPA